MEFDNLSEKEKGYLFGIFEGDGYKLYDKKSRHYSVEFYLNSLKDREIISFIVKLLIKIGLNPNIYQDKRYNCKRIRVYSKDSFNLINKNVELSNKTKDFKIGSISGLIDSEGYVNKIKSFIMVINTNKNLLDKSRLFLEKIGIGCTISKRKPSKKDRLYSYQMYISVKFKSLLHLSIKAGKP